MIHRGGRSTTDVLALPGRTLPMFTNKEISTPNYKLEVSEKPRLSASANLDRRRLKRYAKKEKVPPFLDLLV